MYDTTFERGLDDHRFERVIETISPVVRESFSDAQNEALRDAFKPATWHRQSVDIRLSIPLFPSRYFVTIVAGRDRRQGRRRKAERLFHPLSTIGNTIFMGAITTLICVVLLVAFLVYSAVLSA